MFLKSHLYQNQENNQKRKCRNKIYHIKMSFPVNFTAQDKSIKDIYFSKILLKLKQE